MTSTYTRQRGCPAGRVVSEYGLYVAYDLMTPDKVETRIGTLDFTDGRPSDASLEREDAIEIFYNASVSRDARPADHRDILPRDQPALKKKLSSSGQLTDIDTTVVAGLRFHVRF